MAIQCAWCKKIKTVENTWETGPAYILPESSHGLCPDCKKTYIDPDLEKVIEKNRRKK
jgi:hypothetical protein